MKLRAKLLMLALVPLVMASAVICLITYKRVDSVLRDIIRQDLEAVAVLERDNMTLDDNDYHVDENGDLWNGDVFNITADVAALDEIRESTGIDITVFFGDVRYSTTLKHNGERVLGTRASEDVVRKVLKEGDVYFSEKVDILGDKYFGYYLPLYQDEEADELPVGMIFAGKSQSEVRAEISMIIGLILLVTVLVVASCAVTVWLIANRIVGNLQRGIGAVSEVSGGNLAVSIDPAILKSKDETGDMARAIANLKDTLVGMVGSIAAKSDQVLESATVLGHEAAESSNAVSNVEQAVLEIADGATSQANNTQSATSNVIDMGHMVEETNRNVELLQTNASDMEKSGLHAQEALRDLEEINARAREAIDVIYEQTNTTNESAQRIREAVNLITSIAEETNLLSLNASIEAARAGEQGRGFAVVATQIQKLAEQSNDSARKVDDIITSLMHDSANAVNTMEDVKEIMNRQSSMVDLTSQSFQEVMEGIGQSKENIASISASTHRLDATRESVIRLVSDLSSIAEENAAMTEETSSATTEVSATIQEMSANATHLQSISEELKDSVKIFNI